MRVVLDTNVLISGTFWIGDSFRILNLVDSRKIVLILSKEILEEYDRVVHSDEIMEKSAYREERVSVMRKLFMISEMVTPTTRVQIIKDDPDDNKFLDAAIEGRAKYVVSQDRHLLNLKDFRSIVILEPKEFLLLLQ